MGCPGGRLPFRQEPKAPANLAPTIMRADEPSLSVRSKYKIIMATFALTALVVAASSLTHEIHLVETYDERVAPINDEALMEKDYMLEDLDTVPNPAIDEDDTSELLQPLMEPLEELVEAQDGSQATEWSEESPLDR